MICNWGRKKHWGPKQNRSDLISSSSAGLGDLSLGSPPFLQLRPVLYCKYFTVSTSAGHSPCAFALLGILCEKNGSTLFPNSLVCT